jgi:hypothetical protein
LVLVAGVVVGVVLSAGSGSPKPATSSRSTSGATTVERRDLVETDTESGTLGYANPQTVYDRLSGTITWLPNVGRVIKSGQTLFEVDGEPVILMNGTRPAYRALSASDTAGQDILQLNRNLVDLGFNPDGIVADDEWQAATTAGVDLLQASLGETETGGLPLGQIVFLPGDQLISKVNAAVGSTSGSAGSPASSASTPAAAAGTEFVSLTSTGTTSPTQSTTTTSTTTTSTTTTPKTTKPKKTKTTKPTWRRKPASSSSSQTLQGLTALLKAEAAQLKAATAALKAAKSSTASSGQSSSSKSSSSSSKSSSSSASSSGGSASAILQTNSTQLIVTVDLDAAKQSEAKVGENVTVEMPTGNTVDGKITAVSSVAQSSSGSASGGGSAAGGSGGSGAAGGSSSSSTVPVTIKLKGHQRGTGLDQASVSVNFAQAKARNVLSVPVTALLATSGGGYEVQEATAPYKFIPVTTGLFAAGYVQLSGAGIHPGLQVTDSQG